MRFWLAQTGEDMPSDGPETRLLRTSLLARELAGRGHEVIYCNSTFSHQRKVQRFEQNTAVEQPDGYRAVFLFGRPYARNIGISRILSHRDNARAFDQWARKQSLPDAIHCGFPPIELAETATRYANMANVPSTVDCRDIWPEIISDRLSKPARLLGAPVLGAWERARDRAMRAATAITGVSEGFVDWGVKAAARRRNSLDRPFHLATPSEPVPSAALDAAQRAWTEKLGELPDNHVIVAYAGTFSQRFDFPAVLAGADLLTDDERRRIRIVLCGSGDMDAMIKQRASENSAIVYGGWCSRPELVGLMEMATAGLLPYPNSLDFLITFPNKVGEYLTNGLPILTGTRGAIEQLLDPVSLKIGYQSGSPADFAAALRRLLSEGDKPERRARARKLAQEKFSPDLIYPQFADWLEEVAAEGDGRA